MNLNLARYRKTIVAVVGAGVAILTRQLGADSAVVFDLVTVATALGVFGVPNQP